MASHHDVLDPGDDYVVGIDVANDDRVESDDHDDGVVESGGGRGNEFSIVFLLLHGHGYGSDGDLGFRIDDVVDLSNDFSMIVGDLLGLDWCDVDLSSGSFSCPLSEISIDSTSPFLGFDGPSRPFRYSLRPPTWHRCRPVARPSFLSWKF